MDGRDHDARRVMRISYVLGLLAGALLISACGSSDAPPTPAVTPTPGPDIEATVVAEVQARLGSAAIGTPTAVPLAPAARSGIVTFAASHRQIIDDWDAFHSDFDAWRDGLIACDASSAQVTLRRAAATIDSIASTARSLPRSSSVRELADKIIVAAESEAEALRQLRDGWQPNDPTIYESVATVRSVAQALRREAQDALSDLQELTAASSRASVQTYSVAFRDLGSGWDNFRRDYDSFRTKEPGLTSSQIVAELGELIDDFRLIVVAVRELPADEATREVTLALAQAAEAEDLALRRLRGTFQRSTGAPGDASQEPTPIPEEAPTSDGASASDGTGFAQRDPALLGAFDVQLAVGNALRRQAVQMMEDLLEDTSSESQVSVDEFAQQYDLLLAQWDRFHAGYDKWRGTEGGCDQSAAVTTLGQFTSELAAITRNTRGLPGGTMLGPLRELMVEAAELEEEGLRTLRNAWRPFDVDVYKAFDGRRNSSARLLRQVVVGLDALLARHDIPAPAQ